MSGYGYFVGHPLEASLDRLGEAGGVLTGNLSAARLGASPTYSGGRVGLAVPHGFMKQWHRGEIQTRQWGQEAPSRARLSRLARDLKVGNDAERLAAAEELRRCERHAAPALAAAVVAVGDDLPTVRWRAVEILRFVGPPESSFAVLVEALFKDPCRSVRWRAAEALGAPTLPPLAAARALIKAAHDDDEWVRWHADRVLTQVADWSLVESLLPDYATTSPVPAVKAYAIGLLARSSCVDESLLLRLTKELRHPMASVRIRTIELINRHHLPSRAVRSSLRLSIEDPIPEVRAGAVRAMARNEGRGRLSLVQSALADSDPAVRAAICEALADGAGDSRARRRWLRHALGDARLSVRLASARALMHLGEVDRDIVTVLVDAVARPAPSLEAWQTLLALDGPYGQASLDAAAALPPSSLARLIAEDVAAGTLPTIGLRLWPENARIRYPNKEGGDRPPLALGYPWANVGVFHSWENHLPPRRSRIPRITKQVCLAAAPYPHAHLVAAVELARHRPHHFDGRTAPVHIEGWPVGSILEGTIGSAPDQGVQPRIDFVFGVDLQFCQYATGAALCYGSDLPPDSWKRDASNRWNTFVAGVSDTLASNGLGEFCREQWFDTVGWQSSRYGVRKERPYNEIRAGIVELVAVLRSPRGKQLTEGLLGAADSLAQSLERRLWRERLSTYPPSLRRYLSSRGEAYGNRIWPQGSWQVQLLQEV